MAIHTGTPRPISPAIVAPARRGRSRVRRVRCGGAVPGSSARIGPSSAPRERRRDEGGDAGDGSRGAGPPYGAGYGGSIGRRERGRWEFGGTPHAAYLLRRTARAVVVKRVRSSCADAPRRP